MWLLIDFLLGLRNFTVARLVAKLTTATAHACNDPVTRCQLYDRRIQLESQQPAAHNIKFLMQRLKHGTITHLGRVDGLGQAGFEIMGLLIVGPGVALSECKRCSRQLVRHQNIAEREDMALLVTRLLLGNQQGSDECIPHLAV